MTLMRVDKWIWAVRMVKTRSLGSDLCRAGHVLVNDRKVKPSHEVKIADIVSVNLGPAVKIYKVVSLIERRVSAVEAAACFENLSPPPKADSHLPPVARREKGAGRPTKKDRRSIMKIRDSFF